MGRSRLVAPSITASRIPSRHRFLLHFLFVLSFNERKTEAFTKSVLQVHDDHRSRLYGIAEEGNKADPNGNGEVHAAKE